MDLNDLKNAWDNQDHTAEQNVAPKIIDQIVQEKYHSKIKKIVFPEIIGSMICVAAAVFICISFAKLDTFFLKGVGILSVLLLLVVSIISFLSIKSLNIPQDISQPYAETLKIFATQKLKFYRLQKINITLGYLILVTVIILVFKFFGGKDLSGNKYFWTFSFTIGYIFLLFYSSHVSAFYKKSLKQAEELLKEL